MIKRCITICVVDDDSSVCKAVSRLLTAAGFNVKTYGSAQKFIDSDDKEGISLLVLDIRMPGMNGLDLQKHLAASGHEIPVVFITAYENDRAKSMAMEAGAVAFFQKPFDEKELLNAVYKSLNINYT